MGLQRSCENSGLVMGNIQEYVGLRTGIKTAYIRETYTPPGRV
jgi:hypothetical protein